MTRACRLAAAAAMGLAALTANAWCNAAPARPAAPVRVAVATNFAVPLQALAPVLYKARGIELVIGAASTGKLHAQIRAGAPWDVMLAADTQTPRRLVSSGDGVAGTRFTYAVGELVLVARPNAPALDFANAADALASRHWRALAIANPHLAPYGSAAMEVLRYLDLAPLPAPRLVLGENVAQAFALVATGNADIGLVARSQLLAPSAPVLGASWPIPGAWHTSIRQDAVLLRRAEDNAAARAFLSWLRTAPEAAELMRQYGYSAAGPAADAP
jgi:molybdate transport system substrate-binding protein